MVKIGSLVSDEMSKLHTFIFSNNGHILRLAVLSDISFKQKQIYLPTTKNNHFVTKCTKQTIHNEHILSNILMSKFVAKFTMNKHHVKQNLIKIKKNKKYFE